MITGEQRSDSHYKGGKYMEMSKNKGRREEKGN